MCLSLSISWIVHPMVSEGKLLKDLIVLLHLMSQGSGKRYWLISQMWVDRNFVLTTNEDSFTWFYDWYYVYGLPSSLCRPSLGYSHLSGVAAWFPFLLFIASGSYWLWAMKLRYIYCFLSHKVLL